MLLNSFRDGSRSRYVIFQLPNNYFISFLNLDSFWCNLYRFKFYQHAKGLQFEQRKCYKMLWKLYTSIQSQHSRLFLFCITVAAQMQQMSLFNFIQALWLSRRARARWACVSVGEEETQAQRARARRGKLYGKLETM